jgi:murein DD-endopeptidase MepM/ murein hydrolase activator NlpD
MNMKSSLPESSRILPLLLAGIIVMASCGSAAAVSLSSAKVANGQVTILEINLRDLDPAATDLKARFGQNTIALFQHPVKPSGIYCGLLGIPLRTAPQKGIIELEWTDLRGPHRARIAVNIVAGNYKKEALQVAPRHVRPSPQDLQRIKNEKRQIRRIFASSSTTRLWFGSFIEPLDSDITSAFGTQRLFNGQLQSYHRGTDFRAKTGTPVHVSNFGIVRLAKNLFFSGNIVIVDHGKGVFTNYAHLSKIQAVAGQHVARGDQIGLSGATGRVSGPHLHWGVKVNGSYVDPLQFLTIISDLLGQSRNNGTVE